MHAHPYNNSKRKQMNQNVFLRAVLYLSRDGRSVMVLLGFIVVVALLSSNRLHDDAVALRRDGGNVRGSRMVSGRHYINFGGAVHAGYFSVEGSIIPTASSSVRKFNFAAVTDLDQLSRMQGDKLKFYSWLQPGILTSHDHGKSYSIEFSEDVRKLVGGHNEAGRGMELSELTLYQNRLLAFDDRTGDVFELLNKDSGATTFVVPRFVITEGNGETDKGMKWEWATVKGEDLYIGSMGKEYTREDGSIANTNNLWIAVISPRGEVIHIDWEQQYSFVRKQLGASPPGYCIHEAVLWSEHQQKWMFLPRRISSDAYDENVDERKGSNKLLWVDDTFSKSNVVDIKMATVDPLHGFSTVAFVPGTEDKHAFALRSVEEDCVGGEESVCKQRTYAIVFNTITGEVLMDEVKLPKEVKFEGLEFVNILTSEVATS